MTTADPRDHLVLVLDVERLDDALAYAERMAPWFRIVKVGYELYGAAGPDAFDALHHKGFRVFADLKLHDIPTTVERGARDRTARRRVPQLSRGRWRDDVARRAQRFARGRARRRTRATDRARGHRAHERRERRRARAAHGHNRATWASTVLCAGVPTSRSRAHTACARWCRASVCPVATTHDQARVDTPGDAIARGADWLVVGRAVAAADDPERAAEETTRDVAAGARPRLRLTGCTKRMACVY